MRKIILAVVVACGCGGAQPPPLSSSQPLDLDAIVRLCVMERSCLSGPPFSVGSCVTQIEQQLVSGAVDVFGSPASLIAGEVQCAARAKDCNAALTCASAHHGASWCNAHGPLSCDGNVLVSCASNWGLSRIDCAAFGMRCIAGENGALCSDGNSCSADSPDYCDGNRLVQCLGSGHESTLDCGALLPGGTCIAENVGGQATARCAPAPDKACPRTGVRTTCDGTALLSCVDGHGSRLDCARFGDHCAVGADGMTACAPDANECDASAGDRCAGDDLQVCVNGKWQTIKCDSIGLTRCSATALGAVCG